MKLRKVLSYILIVVMAVTVLFEGISKWKNVQVNAATEPVKEAVYYNITNVCTGRMIDIPSGKDEDKVLLHTWTINNSNAEQFSFEKVSGEDYYYIIPKVAPTRVFDNPASSTAAGTQFQIYTKNSTDAQKFKLESDGDGNYRIINKKSGMALTDMTNEKGTTDEEKDVAIRQQVIANDSRQLWKITKLANEYVFNEPSKPDGADPSVVLAGGKYYYCYSGSGNTVKIALLSSLENMSSFAATTVFTAPSTGMYSKEIWAPELVWVSGRWYVYFAADDGSNANHRMYVLEGGTNPDNPLDGSYTFKGKIYDSSNDRWAIDGTVFTYNGDNYFVWSGWDVSNGNEQNLYIARMSNPWTLSSSRVCISKPTNSWEKSGGSAINEGPEVLINGNKVFIIYSAAGSWTDSYCLGMLTCTDGNFLNASSWTKSANPVFQKTEYTFGPGHNTFVKSVDGTENWIIYHCARYSGSKWTRSIRAQRFTWTDSGVPFFGEPIEQGVAVSRPSKAYVSPVNTTDYYKIVNVGTGKVMDIPNKGDSNGVKVQTYKNNDTIAQRFKFKSNPDKWFNIIPECAPTRAFDNPSGSKDKKVSYQIYTANGSASQKFRFEHMGNGEYRIVNKASLFALTDTSEISGGSGYVEQRKYMNSDYQLWKLVPVKNEETTTQEPTTKEPVTEEQTTGKTAQDIVIDKYGLATSDKVKVIGHQISTKLEGHRVVGSVEPEIDGKKVVHWGIIYGVSEVNNMNTGISDGDMNVASNSRYVRAFQSTDIGTSSYILGTSETATYFVRTMCFAQNSASMFESKYKVRTYAVLEDGTYVYSGVNGYSVYEVAKYLYDNCRMNTYDTHNYLYNTILKKVNSNYKEVDFEWGNTILKPY